MREISVLAISYVSHAASDLTEALANPPHLPPAFRFPLILIETGVGHPTIACDTASKTGPPTQDLHFRELPSAI